MRFNNAYIILLSLTLILFLSCCEQDEKGKSNGDYSEYFPEMEIPADNHPNPDRLLLGKLLFNEKALSLDSTVSCASCHNVNNGLADHRDFSLGVGDSLGLRNSPTLFNIGYHPYFFADGGVPTLELQVMAPIQDEKEMHLSVLKAAERLKLDEYYNDLAKKAYGREMDPYVVTRALACFERTFVSFDSRYDKYVQGDLTVLNDVEKKGMELFFSEKTNCTACHPAPFFTSYEFENIGLERPNDLGRMKITADFADLWKFKVPTLRNVALSAPYFHDGSKSTIGDVLRFFNDGGGEGEGKSNHLKSLNLSNEELLQLEAFLKTLTDISFKDRVNK